MRSYSHKIIVLLVFSLFLSSCGGDKTVFEPGDMREDFCGTYINYQYCGCAFGEQFCEQIAMSPSEAENYVEKEYNAWVERERLVFKNLCVQGGSVYKNDTCRHCPEGETAVDGKCREQNESAKEEGDLPPGACTNDSDCKSTCEGDVMWNMSCNQATNSCERSYDINCRENMETFGELSFSMICKDFECSRDEEAIKKMRDQLEKEIAEIDNSEERRARYNDLMSGLDSLCESATEVSGEEQNNLATYLVLFLTEEDLTRIDIDEEQEEYLEKLLAQAEEGDMEVDVEILSGLSCTLETYIVENKSVDLSASEMDAEREELQSKLDRLPVIY